MICSLRSTVLFGLVVAMLSFPGCSNSSNSSSTNSSAEATIVSISIQGTSPPVWPLTTPTTPVDIPLNAPITFQFGGPVDPATLPAPGPASGSIRITSANTQSPVPATGSFQVQDDPSKPAGNQSRVVFFPLLPANAAFPPSGGLSPDTQYVISVPSAPPGSTGTPAGILNVAGSPLSISAEALFRTRSCTGSDCYTDQTPGDPFILFTTPNTVDPDAGAPVSIDPRTIVNNTVSIFVSEALDPVGISLGTVRLVSSNTQSQVPGAVIFFQTGSFPLPAGVDSKACRIDYVASSTLLSDRSYELIIDPAVRDLGQNSLQLFETPDGTPQRVFATTALPVCPQAPLSEDFSGTSHRDFVSGIVSWEGSGSASSSFALEFVGDGSDNAIVYGPGNHDIETGSVIAGSSPCSGAPSSSSYENNADGVLNATSIVVQAGAILRVYGTRPLRWRSLSSITINGTIDGSAFSENDPICYSSFMPQSGTFNNGLIAVDGGRGGAGGGFGGRASQMGDPRTDFGERGFGPYLDGQANANLPPNDSFGGGSGGPGDFFNPLASQSGGQGGAGGSAYQVGQDGLPREGLGVIPLSACGGPSNNPANPPALASGPVAAWTSPITHVLAGSGGGGGGDKFDNAPPGQNLDEQGSGGGGGGGGFRASCAQGLNVGSSAVIRMDGAPGRAGPTFAGAGGSGSGGMIFLQSLADIEVLNTATLSAEGGGAPQQILSCRSAPGLGGRGLIQLEDSNGVINTNFNTPSPSNVASSSLPVNQTGVAQSTWFDANYGDPHYTGVTEISNVGTAPPPLTPTGQATIPSILIEYQGALESPTNPGTPDESSVSAWITASQISADPQITDPLDGFRFVRFRITLSYASPPASTLADIFPSVSSIEIFYDAPINCGP